MTAENSAGETIFAAPSTSPPTGRASARAPGVCGELVQGMLDGHYFLVTCPIDFYSRVTVEIHDNGAVVAGPDNCPKSRAAVAATLQRLGHPNLGAGLKIGNPIPRSKGMGSSSADVAAAITATGLALGQELTPQIVAELALSVEPSDGVMFPGIVLFDHRDGQIFEDLGPPPPMEIVALDFGGSVDTLEFNRVDRRSQWQSLSSETEKALELVRRGIQNRDPALVGQGATISAEAGQQVLEKPQLLRVKTFVQTVGAVGVCVAHSGTVIGVLLDARQRRGKSTFRQARETFPDAEAVHHFRMMSGGVQSVP